MTRVGVMQMIDALAMGGAERVAVNIANALPQERYRPHVCATRAGGPLAGELAPHVPLLPLNRRGRFDWTALRRLARYVDEHEIRLVHAHSTSLFTAALLRLLRPKLRLVWHDHYGGDLAARPVWPYRLMARRAHAVIAVNDALAQWARDRLRVPAGKVHFLRNFAVAPVNPAPAELPGAAGKRMICVANFRPQKDHATLLEAMARVAAKEPEARLFLVGAEVDEAVVAKVRETIERSGLNQQVSVLGARRDVAGLLAACDVGVLSSRSEGLPLSLIEYGLAGLAAVAARVGQCAEVLDEGRAGALVEPGDAPALAEALLALLANPARSRELGAALKRRVQAHFGVAPFMARLEEIYRDCGIG